MTGQPDQVVPEQERFPRAIFVVLFILTLCLRFLGMMVRHDYQVPQHVGAEAGVIAHNIISGLGFSSPFDPPGHVSPSTHLAPLYPCFLALLLKLGLTDAQVYYRAIFLNLFFCALLPPIVLAIGQAARFPRGVSLLAALAVCFCPEAFRAPGLVWDEAIFVSLSACFLWWMVRRISAPSLPTLGTSAFMGLASGMLALLNPAMVLALPLAWLAALRTRGTPWRPLLLHGVLFMALTFVGSSPWHIRNWFLVKPPAPVFVRGSFWLTTWTGMHPIQRIEEPDGNVRFIPFHPWNGTDPMMRDDHGTSQVLTEAEYFAWTQQRVFAAFRADPSLLPRHVLRQANSFWTGIAEAQRWYKSPWPFFIAQGVPALIGLAGLLLCRKRILSPVNALLWSLLIVYPLPYYLTDASSRYRHPIDAVLYIGCAWFLWVVILRRPREVDGT